MTFAAATWLPPELTARQPYSMGPLTRWAPMFPQGTTLPAMGTCVGMDRSELMIATCFVAPPVVQADAQRRGEKAIIMLYPPGLMELLEADPKLWPKGHPARLGLAPVKEIGEGLVAPVALADAYLDHLSTLKSED